MRMYINFIKHSYPVLIYKMFFKLFLTVITDVSLGSVDISAVYYVTKKK
jgi:hypothetical protein